VHYEFVPRGQTVNQEILWYQCETMGKQCRELRMKHSQFLHYSALAHTALPTQMFLTKNKTPAVPQPRK